MEESYLKHKQCRVNTDCIITLTAYHGREVTQSIHNCVFISICLSRGRQKQSQIYTGEGTATMQLR